jgi:hypothetical protein
VFVDGLPALSVYLPLKTWSLVCELKVLLAEDPGLPAAANRKPRSVLEHTVDLNLAGRSLDSFVICARCRRTNW